MKRPLILLAVGIAMGILWFVDDAVRIPVILAAVCIAGYAAYRKKWVLAVVFVAACLLGGIRAAKVESVYQELHDEYSGLGVTAVGKVVDIDFTGDNQFITLKLETIEGSLQNGYVWVGLYSQYFPCRYGDRLSVIGSFTVPEVGKDHWALHNRARGIRGGMSSSVIKTDKLSEGKLHWWDVPHHAFNVRQSIKENTRNKFPGDEGEMLLGMMLGDKSGFSPELKNDVKLAGAAHTVAVSGLHLNILLTVFCLFAHSFMYRKRSLAIASIIAIVLFYLLVGYTPAVTRAVYMTIITLSACLFGRRGEIYNSMAIAAILLLIVYPHALFDVGFMLSYSATLGIVMFAKPFGSKGYIFNLFVISAAASLGTAYVTAHHFGQINLIGALSNIVIVPLVGVALVGGYATAIIPMLEYALYPVLWTLRWLMGMFAEIEHGNIFVAAPRFIHLIIYLAILHVIYWVVVYANEG